MTTRRGADTPLTGEEDWNLREIETAAAKLATRVELFVSALKKREVETLLPRPLAGLLLLEDAAALVGILARAVERTARRTLGPS